MQQAAAANAMNNIPGLLNMPPSGGDDCYPPPDIKENFN